MSEKPYDRLWAAMSQGWESADRMNSDDITRNVPCNGCTRCCKGDAVRILPHENAAQWHTEAHPYVPGARMLAHKDNGDCVYLQPSGCGIHGSAPQQCRTMDCRAVARMFSWTQARKLSLTGRLKFGVWKRGRELIRSNAK